MYLQDSKYLNSVAATLIIEYDGIVVVMDNLSTKKANNIGKNVTSTASMNCHSKKVRVKSKSNEF